MAQPARIELVDLGGGAAILDGCKADLGSLTSWRRGQQRIGVFDGDLASDLSPILLAQDLSAVIDARAVGGRIPVMAQIFVVRLSTGAALRLDTANAITSGLAQRFPKAGPRQAKIFTALQEAIGNAVLHGNLELETAQRGNLEGLVEFAAEMERRVTNATFAHKAITIGSFCQDDDIVVWVEDCGRGFVTPEARGFRLSSAGGNGIAMIRACSSAITFSRGGRRISMRFGPETASATIL